MLALLLAVAFAEDPGPASRWGAELHGDIKTFGTATFPYDHLLMGSSFEPRANGTLKSVPPDPSGQAVWNLRLKLDAHYDDLLKFQLHHVGNVTLGGTGAAAVQGFGTGVGLTAPETVDLSWEADLSGDSVQVIGITDRASITVSRPGVDVVLGRQPISFGSGLFFTPMDLVNPFTPTTIDTEYKPGVDALRVDGYFGMTGKLTLVAAYAGDWDPEGMVFAAHGQGTLGVTDLGGLVGYVHGEPVFGLTTVTSAGPIGIHADATVTLPADEDVFVRAVTGADWRPTGTTTLSGELYLQTFGTTDPDEYLIVAQTDRFARGEVWNFGVAYGAVSWAQEITPLITSNLAVIGNLTDASAMVAPNLSWSVSENASLGVGGFVGLGKRPDPLSPLDLVDPTTFAPLGDRAAAAAMGLNSEFGLYPAAVFTNFRAYF